jgi:hypothetical protein
MARTQEFIAAKTMFPESLQPYQIILLKNK